MVTASGEELDKRRVLDFLMKLALNPREREAYQESAGAVMASADLSARERTLLASADEASLSREFGEAGQVHGVAVVVVLIVVNVGCN